MKRIKKMAIKQIADFLEKQPERRCFDIFCNSGISIIGAVIRRKRKDVNSAQLVEVCLEWNNRLLRLKGGWFLKPFDSGVGGIYKVRKVRKRYTKK